VNATRDLETELAALFNAQAHSITATTPAPAIDQSAAVAPVVRLDDHQRRRGRMLMVAASVLVLAGTSATLWALSNRRGQVASSGVATVPTLVESPPTVAASPSTTYVPTTLPSPTTGVAASTTTTAPPIDPTSVDMMVGWPVPPAAPDLKAIPKLLPAAAIPGASSAVRNEGADGPSASPYYTQTFVGPTADSAVLEIRTTPASQPVSVTVQGQVGWWDSSAVATMAPGYSSVTVNDPSGTVVLWGKNYDADRLLAIAETLTRRAGSQPGWNVHSSVSWLPTFYEGWSSGFASRSITWSGDTVVAEMSIVGGYADVVGRFPEPWSAADVNGTSALAGESGGRAAVTWATSPGILVRIGLYGTLDDALTIARSVVEVDTATWAAASVVDTSTNDGCNSMFC
jgi:hypothetical protein